MANQNFIDKVVLLSIKDRKVLMARSLGKDKFYMPGGKREEGETDLQTLIRESKEEMDIDVIVETAKHWDTFIAQAHGKSEGVMVKAVCYTADFEGIPKASNEIEEVLYLGFDRRDDAGGVAQTILDDLKGKNMID
ncbi:MAG: NUDIX domain-containing protein [Patescibacteria group bacterium]